MGKQRQMKHADVPEGAAAETSDGGRPGRPPGAGNHDYSKAVTIRGATCPHCGSEDVLVVTGLAPFEPTEYDGVRTDRHRMRCRTCDGRFMRLTQTAVPVAGLKK